MVTTKFLFRIEQLDGGRARRKQSRLKVYFDEIDAETSWNNFNECRIKMSLVNVFQSHRIQFNQQSHIYCVVKQMT